MALPRLHLFELEDLEWFPHTIRNLALDYLGFMEVRFALHKPVMPLLRRMFAQTGTLNVVDLCSGRGELVLALYEALTSEGIDVEFTLTDKFPNLVAFRYISSQHPLKLHYVTGSVDATKVPSELAGLRTIFNAFHHFPPRTARRVLEDAVKAGQPICIFEIPERRLLTIISLLLTPLFVAFATPFIRPFRWKRLLWTYLIPLVPFMCCWDGVISQLRAYTIAELSELTHGLEDYKWSAGNTPLHGQPGHLTYLLGAKRSDNVSLIPLPVQDRQFKGSQSMITMPRSIAIIVGLFVGLIVIPLAHGVLPWALSTRLPRYGWAEGSPRYWNWIGLMVVAPAVALLIWILVFAIPQAPSKVKLGLTPSFLMMRGPYRLTRNPMYVAELGLWLGLAIYFGSLGVLLGFLVLWSVVKFIILPREERSLERAFGQTYLEYKNRVPRWFWKTK